MRVVVIGGLGHFGGRICRRLAQQAGLEIIATSRRAPPAEGTALIKNAVLDIGAADFPALLAALAPDVVIHCAGPFQGQDYRVALATVACDSHYIDIADGREFVTGFVAAVGAAAQAKGRVAITGASTLPALSSAVIDSLRPQFSGVEEIDVVIAPGQRAPRGAATVTAVLGYAGLAFQWWQQGAWRTAHGWQELKRVHLSFGTRCAAACDVPDLELFPARYAEVQTVTFRAALEVSLQHAVLWGIAAWRRAGLSFRAARWAAFLDRIGTWLDWLGGDKGGMSVRMRGRDVSGRRLSVIWELVAEDNHGPEIPCMAAALLACKLRRGEPPASGAQVCMGILGLRDFDAEFARWRISTTTHALR